MIIIRLFQYLFQKRPFYTRIPLLPPGFTSDKKVADVANADLLRLAAKSAIRSEADAGLVMIKYPTAQAAIKAKESGYHRSTIWQLAAKRFRRLL